MRIKPPILCGGMEQPLPGSIHLDTPFRTARPPQYYENRATLIQSGRAGIFHLHNLYDVPCSNKDRKKTSPSPAPKARNGESLAQKIAAEGAAFTKWCDQWDLEVIDRRRPALEVFRLSVIALFAGYKQFTLYLLSCLDEQGMQAVGQVTDVPKEEWRKRYRAWVTNFYHKQPKGRNQNELKERLEWYGEELRRASVLVPKERRGDGKDSGAQ